MTPLGVVRMAGSTLALQCAEGYVVRGLYHIVEIRALTRDAQALAVSS